MSKDWRLLIDCADQGGLVHKTTGVLYRAHCNVLVNHEFADPQSNRFFMRTEFVGDINKEKIVEELWKILPPQPFVKLIQPGKARIAVLATKEHHCLADILTRCAFGELDATVAGVIANHDVLRPFVDKFEIPFHHCSHSDVSREEQERQVIEKLDEISPDYIVLASIHAHSQLRFCQPIRQSHHQHSSLLPAGVHWSQTLSPGMGARREGHRRHRALRHRTTRRGTHHRTTGHQRGPFTQPHRTWPAPGVTSNALPFPEHCASYLKTASFSTATERLFLIEP